MSAGSLISEHPATEAPTRAARVEGEPTVSVIVPVAERTDDLLRLYQAYAAVLTAARRAFEFLFVFDGAFHPPQALVEFAARDPRLQLLKLAHVFGETGALRAGFAQSRGHVLLTLPSYFQIEPSGLPQLFDALEGGADLAVARRHPRRDGWVNRLQSRLFHGLFRAVTRAPFHDIACGARLMRREVAEGLPLYGDLHRFIPMLARRQGFQVVEVPTPQHSADRRTRLYGPGTYIRRLLDIFAVFFLLKFTEKPLRFFGLVGSALFAAGSLVCLVLAIQRLGGQGLANRPLLLLGVLLTALGVQVIALGLVGEIVVHWRARERRTYRVKRVL